MHSTDLLRGVFLIFFFFLYMHIVETQRDSQIYRHSVRDCGSSILYLSVCVCPALTAYISVSMGQIQMKHSDNVRTQAQLIVLKFHKSSFSNDVTMMSFLIFFSFFFFFFFFFFCWHFLQQRDRIQWQRDITISCAKTVILPTAILFKHKKKREILNRKLYNIHTHLDKKKKRHKNFHSMIVKSNVDANNHKISE